DEVFAAWQDSAELTGAAVGSVPLALSELLKGEVDADLGDAGVRAASGPDAVRGSLPDSRDAVWLTEPTVARDTLREAEAAPVWPALAAAILFLASADHGDPRRRCWYSCSPRVRGPTMKLSSRGRRVRLYTDDP